MHCAPALLLSTTMLAAQPATKPLQGPARAAFLQKIEKAMSGLQSVAARFVQEKQLKLFGDTVRTQGLIAFARPDSLRWEIRKPFRSLLIVTGRRVAKFEFGKDGRRKLELGRGADLILMVMTQIRGWFRGDFEASAKVYKLEVFAAPRARIVLRPKERGLAKNLDSITLRIAKDLRTVDRVTIRERGGDQTVMRFGPPKAGVTLAPACFDTDKPAELDPLKLALQPVPKAKQPGK